METLSHLGDFSMMLLNITLVTAVVVLGMASILWLNLAIRTLWLRFSSRISKKTALSLIHNLGQLWK